MANLWSVAPSLHSAAYLLGKFYELGLRNGTHFWPECATCVSIYLPCSAHPFPGREENWRAKAARHSTNNLYLQGEHSSTRFLPSSDSHKFLFPNCRCLPTGSCGFSETWRYLQGGAVNQSQYFVKYFCNVAPARGLTVQPLSCPEGSRNFQKITRQSIATEPPLTLYASASIHPASPETTAYKGHGDEKLTLGAVSHNFMSRTAGW